MEPSSRLDLFLTDHSDSFSVESYPFASDHVAVIARGNLKIPPPVKHERIIRQYHRTDWDGLQNFLSAKPWSTFLKEAPHKAAALYEKAITEAIEQFVPSKTVKVSSRDKPWFNAGCRKAIRARKKAHKKWRSTESDEDRAAFISARNESVKAVRQARADYKHKFVDKLKSAPAKRWWRVVKEALPSSKSTSIPSLHVEGTMI